MSFLQNQRDVLNWLTIIISQRLTCFTTSKNSRKTRNSNCIFWKITRCGFEIQKPLLKELHFVEVFCWPYIRELPDRHAGTFYFQPLLKHYRKKTSERSKSWPAMSTNATLNKDQAPGKKKQGFHWVVLFEAKRNIARFC